MRVLYMLTFSLSKGKSSDCSCSLVKLPCYGVTARVLTSGRVRCTAIARPSCDRGTPCGSAVSGAAGSVHGWLTGVRRTVYGRFGRPGTSNLSRISVGDICDQNRLWGCGDILTVVKVSFSPCQVTVKRSWWDDSTLANNFAAFSLYGGFHWRRGGTEF